MATARELHANFYDVNNSKPLSAISRAAIDRLPVLANELDALVAAVERVQALHTPDEFGMCEGCRDNEHGYAIVPHPCPTIRALETPK
ncbi:hypothetical protein [Rhodococcus sp. (in: high G+C Gram-positive bacteria)]|uniref:hypothetical protein n=1 Tax=Rhodococcus sp. TaxID=1831 RepID=UPI003314AA7C